MLKSVIQRASLGRFARIGDFYDARTDSLLTYNLFGSKVDEVATDTMEPEENSLSIELVMSDSLQEKFNKLEVDAELQVSVLAGFLTPSGSGAYLREERKSDQAKSMSLLFKFRTVSDETIIRQNRNKIDIEVLESQARNATHVIFGIDWGAICSVTCECVSKGPEDADKVNNELRQELENLKELFESAKAGYSDRNTEKQEKFTFKCKADILDPDKDMPGTFEGALELVGKLQSLIKGTNKGKGVPLNYVLMPVDSILRISKVNTENKVEYEVINEDIANKCAQAMEDITKKGQVLHDFRNDLHPSLRYVPEEHLKNIGNSLETFAEKRSHFTKALKDLVRKVRSRQENVIALNAFISADHFETWYNEEILLFQKNLSKLKSIGSWKDIGVRYIGRNDSLHEDKIKYGYVFYKSDKESDKENVDRNQGLFLRLHKTYGQDGNYQFIIVDGEIRKDLWPADGEATIHIIEDGKQVCTDLYERYGQDSEVCLIKVDEPIKCTFRPRNRAPVRLRCPNVGNGQCAGSPTTWMCSRCKEDVEYGTDTKLFYCKCGESDPLKSSFCCSESNHGMTFVSYPGEILRNELSQHQALEEKNILILGETGVGKSTWINCFQNYLHFADLQSAVDARTFPILICASFCLIGEHGAINIVLEGANKSEKVEIGSSATRVPHSYVFNIGKQRIRLIDTPGIGTTGGIEQDKKNFRNILSYLANYQEIHAICILLKPNNARLTAMFRFCIQELLAHLHSSAKENLIFCFTHSRGTFYKPGDTLGALNLELRKKGIGIQATQRNYFCFDNEAFRYVACLRNKVNVNVREKNIYAESWRNSANETNNLLDYINTLKPHKIKNTINMNEARGIIVAMSKPLAEVAKTIQHNVQKGEDMKTKIDQFNKDVQGLQPVLKFSGFGLKRKPLEHPRTVCAHTDCISHVPVGEERVQKTIYKQICHKKCTLSGVETETTNDRRLKRCRCIHLTNSTCTACGHHYNDHMHITYDTEVFTEEFLSKDVQEQIQQKESGKEMSEAIKKEIDVKKAELEAEKTTIINTCAKYGSFLKANALLPYNDAVGDYIDMCIEHEQKAECVDANLLRALKTMRDDYEKEKKTLDDALGTNTGANIHTPEDVLKLQEELFRLKHMGKTLKDLFEGISISHSAKKTFTETTVPAAQNSRLSLIPKRFKFNLGKSKGKSDQSNVGFTHALPTTPDSSWLFNR